MTNSTGSTVLGDQVEFVIDRPNTGPIAISSAASVPINGSISGKILTITEASGTVLVGESLTGTGIAAGTTITAFDSGTNGGVGTYTLSTSQGTVSSETMSVSPNHFTAQLIDAQNVRVASYNDGSGNDFVVLAYGDATVTNLVEFKINNDGASATEVASIADPTTTPFSTLSSLGNGLFALEYDNVIGSSETSFFNYKIFDFGTSGININDSTLANGQNQYVIGTHFTDSFIGENNVNNLYYFVGQAATGAGPTDSFDGGSGGWNIAVFADARSDYTITTESGGPPLTTQIVSNSADPAHTGTLNVQNAEILAFDPNHDPTPVNGVVDVTGGTYVVLGQETTPLTIEAGATAELDITATGATASPENVTFAASTGTLVLDQATDFHGTISGISGTGDVLELSDSPRPARRRQQAAQASMPSRTLRR